MKKLIPALWVLITTVFASFFLLFILSKRLNPLLYKYVNVEAKRFTSNIINSSVNEIIYNSMDEDLFELKKNGQDEIEVLDYNTKKVNILLKQITNAIQEKLLSLEEGDIQPLDISSNFKKGRFKSIKNGVLCEIPIGSLGENSFFNNLGPTIPIRLSFVGQVQANLNTKVTSYGINNLVIEVSIHVSVEEEIVMPIMSKEAIFEVDAPLTIKIIQGTVPNYYLSGIEANSNTISSQRK